MTPDFPAPRLLFRAFLVVSCCLSGGVGLCQQAAKAPSIQEIRSLLDAIDPYLPRGEVTGEIDVVGSTTMDALAHGWAANFSKFHPKTKVTISAAGSETVFERLRKNPTGVGMMSRPVTEAELSESGLKHPVAVVVSREALGVFVHKENPLKSITFAQLATLFCGEDSEKPVTWSAVGVTGPLADQPVHLVGRNKRSGSQRFVEQYLFRSRHLHAADETFSSSAKAVEAVENDPAAIAICGLKCGSHDARALHLREGDKIVQDDDHAILFGQYPLTRPLTLIIDAGMTGEKAEASREFVRFALSQAGQMQGILAGFFPLDPPTLRGELLMLDESVNDQKSNASQERLSAKPSGEERN